VFFEWEQNCVFSVSRPKGGTKNNEHFRASVRRGAAESRGRQARRDPARRGRDLSGGGGTLGREGRRRYERSAAAASTAAAASRSGSSSCNGSLRDTPARPRLLEGRSGSESSAVGGRGRRAPKRGLRGGGTPAAGDDASAGSANDAPPKHATAAAGDHAPHRGEHRGASSHRVVDPGRRRRVQHVVDLLGRRPQLRVPQAAALDDIFHLGRALLGAADLAQLAVARRLARDDLV